MRLIFLFLVLSLVACSDDAARVANNVTDVGNDMSDIPDMPDMPGTKPDLQPNPDIDERLPVLGDLLDALHTNVTAAMLTQSYSDG